MVSESQFLGGHRSPLYIKTHKIIHCPFNIYGGFFPLSFEKHFQDKKQQCPALPRPIKQEWRWRIGGRVGNYTVQPGWKSLSSLWPICNLGRLPVYFHAMIQWDLMRSIIRFYFLPPKSLIRLFKEQYLEFYMFIIC